MANNPGDKWHMSRRDAAGRRLSPGAQRRVTGSVRSGEIIPPRDSLPDLREPVAGKLLTPREMWDVQENMRRRRVSRDVSVPLLPPDGSAQPPSGETVRRGSGRGRQSSDARSRAFWRSYQPPPAGDPPAYAGRRQTREEYEAGFGSGAGGFGPSLSERAYWAMLGSRPAPGVPTWDRWGYVEPGGDVRTERTLRALWAPWAYRSLDFRDVSYRCDLTKLDHAFRGWLTAFRKELKRRYIPLVASDASNCGVCFSLWEDADRTMHPHRGGRFRDVSPAEWSVLHAIGCELARARQVPVSVHPDEPWTFWHCDPDGVVPEADLANVVPSAVFVTDGPGFSEDGDVLEGYIAADGWRWFGREPLA